MCRILFSVISSSCLFFAGFARAQSSSSPAPTATPVACICPGLDGVLRHVTSLERRKAENARQLDERLNLLIKELKEGRMEHGEDALPPVSADGFRVAEVKRYAHEISVQLAPGEPTTVTFPSEVKGGWKRKDSALSIARGGAMMVVFGFSDLSEDGEGVLVELTDGRLYTLRFKKAAKLSDRDTLVKIQDQDQADAQVR